MTMQPINRFSAGRFLQCCAIGKGVPSSAVGYAEAQPWVDRTHVVAALKAAVTGMDTADFAGAFVPVADAFLAAMRGYSVPMRLANLRKVPMLTRLFVNTAGVGAAQVAEGAAIPVRRGTWATVTLEPKKFAAIVTQTGELVNSTSPEAALALQDDLAQATAEAENLAFCGPWTSGSVLDGAVSFAATGNTASTIADDLRRLVELVPGSFRPGAAWLMHPATAAYIGSRYASGNTAPSFPGVGPQGGMIMGLPVLTSTAMEQTGSPAVRAIALVDPLEILWADEGKAALSASSAATMKMDDAATAAAGDQVSMFHTGSIATKAIRESSWYARAGAGAFIVTTY